jgi:hypothetical protein
VKHYRFLWFLVVALGISLWMACSDSNDPTAPPAGPITVPDSVSFRQHVQPIFTARCAVAGCHVEPNPEAGLVLTSHASYGNIVNVPTQVFTPGLRVKPFDPDSSVLYLLVQRGLMPGQGARLTAVQTSTIKRWIVQGALNN